MPFATYLLCARALESLDDAGDSGEGDEYTLTVHGVETHPVQHALCSEDVYIVVVVPSDDSHISDPEHMSNVPELWLWVGSHSHRYVHSAASSLLVRLVQYHGVPQTHIHMVRGAHTHPEASPGGGGATALNPDATTSEAVEEAALFSEIVQSHARKQAAIASSTATPRQQQASAPPHDLPAEVSHHAVAHIFHFEATHTTIRPKSARKQTHVLASDVTVRLVKTLTQSDLSPRSVVALDCGACVVMWVGEEARNERMHDHIKRVLKAYSKSAAPHVEMRELCSFVSQCSLTDYSYPP